MRHGVTVGDFIVDGERRSWFVDVEHASLYPDCMLLVADSFLSLLPSNVSAIGGPSPTANAIVFPTAAVAATRARMLRTFSVEERTSALSGVLQPGDHVALFDSVVTDGAPLLRAAAVVRERGAGVVLFAAVFDAGGTFERTAESHGLPFLSLVTTSDLGLT